VDLPDVDHETEARAAMIRQQLSGDPGYHYAVQEKDPAAPAQQAADEPAGAALAARAGAAAAAEAAGGGWRRVPSAAGTALISGVLHVIAVSLCCDALAQQTRPRAKPPAAC
jgi:hypothetical protein